MPHVPLFTAPEFKGRSAQGLYGDVIQEIDWSVGQIVSTLDRTGLSDNTLIIFTSDNGPWLSYGNHSGRATPLREGKGTTWEGGVRVPAIMKWPGRIPAGAVCHTPAMTIDILPTIAGLTTAPLPPHTIDGKDIWPLMSGDMAARSPHRAYYFYYHRNEFQGLRSGRWKLYYPHRYRTLNGRAGGRDGQPVPYDSAETGYELYDLDTDVSEATNIANQYPQVVSRLKSLAEKCIRDLGDSRTNVEGTGHRPAGQRK